MARVRPLHTYPVEFWDIIQGAAVGGKDFVLVCDKITKALSLQGKYYSFRQALAREALTDPKAEELRLLALNVICWVDKSSWTKAGGGPVTVKFCHKNKHPDSVLLRTMKVEEAPLPAEVVEKVESVFERAMRLQKELEPKDPTGGKYG